MSYVTTPTDVLFDINGYFAPPAPSGLEFYPVTPCRIADTRAAAGFPGRLVRRRWRRGASRIFPDSVQRLRYSGHGRGVFVELHGGAAGRPAGES